jgi:hypothetical protein
MRLPEPPVRLFLFRPATDNRHYVNSAIAGVQRPRTANEEKARRMRRFYLIRREGSRCDSCEETRASWRVFCQESDGKGSDRIGTCIYRVVVHMWKTEARTMEGVGGTRKPRISARFAGSGPGLQDLRPLCGLRSGATWKHGNMEPWKHGGHGSMEARRH